MHFLYGVLAATAAIIISEIVFNYGLGDFLKDFTLRIFGRVESFTHARLLRAEGAASRLRAKLYSTAARARKVL
jgi:hypothetical protein